MRNNAEHRIAILGAVGGNLFDYYIDKGEKKINIYAEYPYIETLVALYEQAFWLGIDIENIYSNKETVVAINFFEKSAIKRIKTLNIKKAINETTPFITIGALSFKFIVEHHTFTELFNYSFMKHVLFDKILAYKEIYAKDLKVVIFTFPDSHHIKNANEWEKNAGGAGRVDKEKLPEFYRQLGFYEDEIELLTKQRGTLGVIERRNGVFFLKDQKYPHINVTGGYRLTTDVPLNTEHNIYMFGYSTLVGFDVFDEYTLPSVIQREFVKHYGDDFNYSVINCGNGGFPNNKSQVDFFMFHKPQNGDIVIFVMNENSVNLLRKTYADRFVFIEPHREIGLFDRPHDYDEVYANSMLHFTNTSSELLGKYLAKKMIEDGIFDENVKPQASMSESNTPKYQQVDRIPLPPTEKLVQYIQETKKIAPRIGSIVMNCNPFTLGHRYLIEQSAKKVTALIIFVVEEDKSFFPFADRIELVRKGTADLLNVTVVPSGGFIISQQTFGAYFEKDSNKEQQIDPTNDVEIFASNIAPGLGITIRFAGEEPLDYITRQYNDTMARILPRYNIDFEVIPRKEFDGKVISASRVRELLKDKKFDEIAGIVPKSTLDYLKEKFNSIIHLENSGMDEKVVNTIPQIKEIKISVIMPVYNVSDYVDYAIKSVLSQSFIFFQYAELILVNDGSSDDSGKICEQYAILYPNNVVYIKQEHLGVSSARNRGLEIARGKLIGFLDADDYFSPKVFQNVLEIYGRHWQEIDIIALPVTTINEVIGSEQIFGYIKNKKANARDTMIGKYNCTRFFFTKKIIANIRFDERVIIYEDVLFTAKVLYKNSIFVMISTNNDAFYYYRIRPSMDSVKQLLSYDSKYKNNLIESSRVFSTALHSDLSNTPQYEKYLQHLYLKTFVRLCFANNNIRKEIFGEINLKEIKESIRSVLSQFDINVILALPDLSLSSRLFIYNNILNRDFDFNLSGKDDDLYLFVYNDITQYNLSKLDNVIIHITEYNNEIELTGLFHPVLNKFKDRITFFAEYKDSFYESSFSSINFKNLYYLDECVHKGELFTFKIPYIGKGEITFGLRFDGMLYKSYVRHAISIKESKMRDYKNAFVLGQNTIIKKIDRGLFVEDKTNKSIVDSIDTYLSNLNEDKKTPGLRDLFDFFINNYEEYRNKKYWLFIDDPSAADDNAWHLFRYIHDNKLYRNIKYVANQEVIDRIKFTDDDIFVVHGSKEHLLVTMYADTLLSSRAMGDNYKKTYPKDTMEHLFRLTTHKMVFLQHGITITSSSHWLNAIRGFHLFITAAYFEHKSIVNSNDKAFSGGVVKMTGFPRFDNLQNESEKMILFLPTWRSSINTPQHYLNNKVNTKFCDTKYYKAITNFANHPKLLSEFEKHGYIMCIRPNNLTLLNMIHFFKENDYVKLIGKEISYQELYKKAAIAITDFSSAIFDFAYLQKPVLYYQFPSEMHHLPPDDVFNYESMGFGEVTEDLDEIVDYIIKYMQEGCIMKDKYKERVNKCFAYHDRNNCERVYQEIIKL